MARLPREPQLEIEASSDVHDPQAQDILLKDVEIEE